MVAKPHLLMAPIDRDALISIKLLRRDLFMLQRTLRMRAEAHGNRIGMGPVG